MKIDQDKLYAKLLALYIQYGAIKIWAPTSFFEELDLKIDYMEAVRGRGAEWRKFIIQHSVPWDEKTQKRGGLFIDCGNGIYNDIYLGCAGDIYPIKAYDW